MTKKTLISIYYTLIVIIIALGGYNLAFKTKTAENITPIKTNTTTKETTQKAIRITEKTTGRKMSFNQFIKQDFGSYKCEVKQALSDIENTGTVYMNEGKLRGEFSTIAEGKKVNSFFVMKDGYTYNWSSLVPMGVKVKIPETSTAGNTDTNTSGTYSWNAEQIGEYNCEEWKTDESMFALPANIKFTEIKA